MKSSTNISDEYKIVISPKPLAHIYCPLCKKIWAGIKDCCGQKFPVDLVDKRTQINTVFWKYFI